MDGGLADASDWLETSLSSFSGLESALRCQVCKDFYATPMITSCSHTFCSICIRRCLSNDAKCPTCRSSDQASKLRRNWSLEEVVSAFQTARPVALDIATNHKKEQDDALTRPVKRRRVAQEQQQHVTQTQTRQTRSQRRNMTTTTQQEAIEVADDGDDDYVPEDGLVTCPICYKRMKEEAVFSHIGTSACDQAGQTSNPSNPLQPSSTRLPFTKPTERLGELNYSLLNEKAMRKKLQELGIPASGSKAIMSRRHTEWVNLWNSNCDATTPRSKRELLDELRKWDRAQGEQARDPDAHAGSGVMKKDFDSNAWASNNKDDFSRLINEARKKKQAIANSKHQSDQQASATELPDTTHPYENNPRAMSSIREKVDAANAGKHMEPILNKDYNEALNQVSAPSSSQQPVSLVRDSSLPEHFITAPTTTMPMFEVPGRPVADIDTAQGDGR